MQIGDTAHLTLFSLILMRMSGFILFNPIFGRRNIPTIVKSSMIFYSDTGSLFLFTRDCICSKKARSNTISFC